jgi:hypothetical protein
MFFIDESGSIPKYYSKKRRNRYFVISFVHTDDPNRIKNVYNRTLRKLKREFPDFFKGLTNPNEPKGSEYYPFMKLFIVGELFRLTDIKLAHMVVDNTQIEERFRVSPARSFNYLVKLVINQFPLTFNDKRRLELHIDNRNTAIQNLSELEGYLFKELVLHENRVKDVSVKYHDSKYSRPVQVADVFANIYYQRFRYMGYGFPDYKKIKSDCSLMHPYTMEFVYDQIKKSKRLEIPFMYPPYEKAQVAASVELL